MGSFFPRQALYSLTPQMEGIVSAFDVSELDSLGLRSGPGSEAGVEGKDGGLDTISAAELGENPADVGFGR